MAPRSIAFENDGSLDEYSSLNRYISTYRDSRYASSSHDGASDAAHDKSPKKRRWFTPWRRKSGPGDDDFKVPDDWLRTDPKQGLQVHDIEHRRKKVGWNELTAEKENMFLKFLSYFTGPILYGTYTLGGVVAVRPSPSLTNIMFSYGIGGLLSSRPS
ncbi:hypothetical protein Plec18170_004324 [Paecilomyces lecythidis]